MTLERLDLDDLTWADLVDQVRAAIPAESDGAWTLHAPVDPGMTILELYAAKLEERLYWLDQVPDALVLASLGLVGVDPPRPAVPAATVLRLDGPAGTVPAGAVFRSPGDPAGVELTTDEDTATLAGPELRLVIDGVDRTPELGRTPIPVAIADGIGAAAPTIRPGVDLLPADGGHGQAEIVVRASEAPADRPGAALALAFVVEAPPELAAGWAPDALAPVPPPADLRWWYEDGDGHIVEFDAGTVDDRTGGLRRSGLVRLPWPETGWTGSGPIERRLRISTEAATYSAPPRLLGVWVNATTARHRREVDSAKRPDVAEDLHRQLAELLPLPGQELILPGAAGRLIDDPARVAVALVESDGERHEWRAIGDLGLSGPDDRVFVIDRVGGLLRFGDGYAGRIPVPGQQSDGSPIGVAVRYELGGGPAGNLGSDVSWVAVDGEALAATNVVPVDGGREAESVSEARDRAAGDLGRRWRAVSNDDHAALATDTASLGVAVARVYVATGRHPAFPCSPVPGAVSVIVIPSVPTDPATGRSVVAAPRTDPGTLATVEARLQAARLIGAEVFVEAPTYRPVDVAVTLDGDVADMDRAKAAVAGAIGRLLDPIVGGEAGDGWPFGAPIRPSALFGVAQTALGIDGTVASATVGIDGAEPTVDCDDVVLAPHELPRLTSVTVRPGPRLGLAGGLR